MGLQDLSGDVTGTVTVGRYVFEVGNPAGMRLTLAPPSTKAATGPVAEALAQRGAAQPAPMPDAEQPEFVDDASRVTDVAERMVRLFGAVAGGNAVDPELVGAEIYAALGLLDRLDQKGRCDKAIRVAQAASMLLALTLRWVELVHALDVTLRAGRQISDSHAEAWALHDLGSLMLGADDVRSAVDFLGRARDVREQLGEPKGLCHTEHNLVLALERLRMVERYGLIRRRTLLLGGATLLLGGGIGLESALGNERSTSGPAMPNTTPAFTATPAAATTTRSTTTTGSSTSTSTTTSSTSTSSTSTSTTSTSTTSTSTTTTSTTTTSTTSTSTTPRTPPPK